MRKAMYAALTLLVLYAGGSLWTRHQNSLMPAEQNRDTAQQSASETRFLMPWATSLARKITTPAYPIIHAPDGSLTHPAPIAPPSAPDLSKIPRFSDSLPR